MKVIFLPASGNRRSGYLTSTAGTKSRRDAFLAEPHHAQA